MSVQVKTLTRSCMGGCGRMAAMCSCAGRQRLQPVRVAGPAAAHPCSSFDIRMTSCFSILFLAAYAALRARSCWQILILFPPIQSQAAKSECIAMNEV